MHGGLGRKRKTLKKPNWIFLRNSMRLEVVTIE